MLAKFVITTFNFFKHKEWYQSLGMKRVGVRARIVVISIFMFAKLASFIERDKFKLDKPGNSPR